jgi:hypothetical protein
MNSPVPLLKLYTKDPVNKYMGYIEINAHKFWIDDLNAFYSEMGYTNEMQLNGVMPDEYIWETFVRHQDNRNCHSCYQLHILSYLFKFSNSFNNSYGHKCTEWIAAEMELRAACTVENCKDRL